MWAVPTDEQQREKMGRGREAAVVLQVATPIFDEQFEGMITNAMQAYRSGNLNAQDALVFVAKLVAVFDVREELIDRVRQGEMAAQAVHSS